MPKQPITVNFAKGLNQKADPRQAAFDSFLSLENMTFTKSGLLQKRNGFPSLPKTVDTPTITPTFNKIPSSIAVGNTVAAFNRELVETDGLGLYSYSPADQNWIYKGRSEAARIGQDSVFQNQLNNLSQDSATNSSIGLAVYAWESWTNQPLFGGSCLGVQLSIVDTANGLTIQNVSLASTTSRPKCISIGSLLYVLYFDTADNKLHAQPVSQTGLGSAAAIISNIDTTNINYDAVVFNSLLYVAYNGASSTVRVASFNSAMTSVATASKVESASSAIGIFTDASLNAWVAYNNGTQTKAFILDSTLATTILAPTTIDSSAAATGVHNITGIFDGTQGIIFYDKPGALAIGQPTGFTSGSFTQPAVNATVVIDVGALEFPANGTVVYIPTGGYYYAIQPDAGFDDIVLNLGLPGNASPGATVAASPQIIYTTNGYINASITFNTLTSAGTVGTPAAFLRSCGLGSRAFLQNGIAHVVAAYDSIIQPTYFVCSLYNVIAPIIDAHVCGKIAAGEAGGLPVRSLLCSVNSTSSGVWQCAMLQRTFLLENTSGGVSHSFWFNGVVSNSLDFSVTNLSKLSLGNNFLVAGGIVDTYDGASVVEQNFHLFPENLTVTTTSGGFLSAGTYSYVAVYSYIDKSGQFQRSAPSLQVTIVTEDAAVNTLVIPTLRVTEKTAATIEIYRTIADGTVFFRIDTQEAYPINPEYPVNNDTGVNTITFIDPLGDDAISGNQQLYTTGELENSAPPPALVIFEYNNTAILIPSDNPYTYWYSKPVVPGNPVEFSGFLQKNVGTIGGPLTGGARMDDKIILGKKTSLYYVTGSGAAASGVGDTLSDPIYIPTDVGMDTYQSLAFGKDGLYFKSLKGIYRLDRGLSSFYVGSPVQNFNSFAVRGAQIMNDSYQIRFLLDGGKTLMFDYDQNQWGEFDNPPGISDCIYNNAHTYIDASGTVYQETAGTYVDGTSKPVLMSFKTANLNLAGISGYERIYDFILLAQYLSPHQIQLQVSYDYLSPVQSQTITPTTSNLEQWRVHAKRQLCQAFQISLQEIYTGTPGAGFSMSGVTLKLGIKSAFRPIPGASATGLS